MSPITSLFPVTRYGIMSWHIVTLSWHIASISLHILSLYHGILSLYLGILPLFHGILSLCHSRCHGKLSLCHGILSLCHGVLSLYYGKLSQSYDVMSPFTRCSLPSPSRWRTGMRTVNALGSVSRDTSWRTRGGHPWPQSHWRWSDNIIENLTCIYCSSGDRRAMWKVSLWTKVSVQALRNLR